MTQAKKVINLALQGGGAHGAFTWGVLDRFLEDERISIEGVSGVSAGAMNAVVLAQGLLNGGAEGGREALQRLWKGVSSESLITRMTEGLSERIHTFMEEPLAQLTQQHQTLVSLFSGAKTGFFDANPLDSLVRDIVDFERLRTESPVRLFIGATEVRTGKLRLFETPQISPEVVLASACLPSQMNKGVEIDGELYWDGGFSANPAIYPLIFKCQSKDIVTVLLGPLVRKELPKTQRDIFARTTELIFNSTYLREMQAITRAKAISEGSFIFTGKMEKQIGEARFHHIEAEELMNELDVFSKGNTRAEFLGMLKQQGRERAELFLSQHFDDLGERSTVDLDLLFH